MQYPLAECAAASEVFHAFCDCKGNEVGDADDEEGVVSQREADIAMQQRVDGTLHTTGRAFYACEEI